MRNLKQREIIHASIKKKISIKNMMADQKAIFSQPSGEKNEKPKWASGSLRKHP